MIKYSAGFIHKVKWDHAQRDHEGTTYCEWKTAIRRQSLLRDRGELRGRLRRQSLNAAVAAAIRAQPNHDGGHNFKPFMHPQRVRARGRRTHYMSTYGKCTKCLRIKEFHVKPTTKECGSRLVGQERSAYQKALQALRRGALLIDSEVLVMSQDLVRAVYKQAIRAREAALAQAD